MAPISVSFLVCCCGYMSIHGCGAKQFLDLNLDDG